MTSSKKPKAPSIQIGSE